VIAVGHVDLPPAAGAALVPPAIVGEALDTPRVRPQRIVGRANDSSGTRTNRRISDDDRM
jgi:hypothetical protein